ncbi:low affinity immunoglobulin epsilon Fc receptor isoform X2 [Ochotona curzoniae]|uniref:low affinity immunoglobulin epsilon Fc receptor isoform X2 n=1 Tax=Ochotona curzoniae TaxID=130825 RepID=UPI001B34A5B8|nr:low affinity immunoglobulin epsilon Fc receptor isoform X2 [Ochotona curzoniae]
MEEHQYSGFSDYTRKRCCNRDTRLALVGLLTTALWAGLLALLLLWHWDTLRSIKQLEESVTRNVSQVSKDLQRYQGERAAQRSDASEVLRVMQRLRAEQNITPQDSKLSHNLDRLQEDLSNFKSQNSRLSHNLDRLQEDLSNFKSQSLNEKRTASDLLKQLQEEVAKLWMKMHVADGSSCNTCPENWISFQHKCYYFGEESKQWVQARFACDHLQGRLVSIHSQEEQDFLTQRVSMRGSWIGLRDLDREGEFIWMDGRPLDYSNWSPGEPNNGGQGEDCVMMLGSGHWNDAFCRSRLDAWVCERLATCGPPTAAVATVATSQPLQATEPR